MLGRAALLGLVAALAPAAVVRGDNAQGLGDVLAGNKDVSTYYELIKIVAPSNDAFKKYQGWNSDNQTLVTHILEYHILQGTMSTKQATEGPAHFAATLLKDKAYTNVTGGQNVIVYRQPGDTVVFASGDGSRSTLEQGDIPFAGGLIQVVDTLLVPPPRLEVVARVAYPDLTAFLGAVYQAGLLEEFASTENVTVFAPRNAAFQRVAGALSALDPDTLRKVLRHHLVPGRVLPSTALLNGSSLVTAAGAGFNVRVTQAGNNMWVDTAQVAQPDILLANGVLHVVDNVLNPDAAGQLPDPRATAQPPAFPQTGATSTGSKAPTPFTSALPCTANCPTPTTSSSSSATGNGRSSSASGLRTSTPTNGGGGARCTGMAVAAVAAAGAMGLAGVV
ncbi:uncharacterized protein E0L32_012110 [Thyridium curvatum]|uniref:FAS1 domain-containing protein n=1 Tax=Thyridium curvatum TaxID=1093900 RepID=A0A507BLN0_9PEZI|nr:uncharacterized protein E0L32_012110 [Thyridium curvatum]TPX17600.1 hypothetical protein E0L32_012110 [Thyridium curvatum]